MPQNKIYPRQLADLMQQSPSLFGETAIDTETSGLWTDAGARVSTVSVAWVIPDEQIPEWAKILGGGEQHLWEDGIWTLRREVTAMARASAWTKGGWVQEHWVLSMAWPFDQGTVGTGKVEDPTESIIANGKQGLLGGLEWQPDLPPAHPNLGVLEWLALLEWLREVGQRYGLVMHNAKFDIHQMAAGVRRWQEPVLGLPLYLIDLMPYVKWDTQGGNDLWVAWRTADVGKPTTSLKPTGTWLWGEHEGDEKTVISEYLRKHKLPTGRWDLMPWPIIAKYADQDARLTIRLYLWQVAEQQRVKVAAKMPKTPEDGWRAGWDPELFERRMEVTRMLVRVERRGVPFSVAMAREASEALAARSAEVEAKLARVLGDTVTLPVAKHYWFGKGDKLVGTGKTKVDVRGLGYEPYEYTAGGDPKVDQAVLSKMLRDGLPMVEEWQAYKKLEDARGRWYDGWADRAGPDGRLRAGFRQNGTASGRFSVENLQLQAIPADYKVRGVLEGIPSPRDLIEAGIPEGYELWEMDLAQAELRVAAQMAGCQKMLDLIDQGVDLHGYTAEELFGVHPGDPDWGLYRQVAKRGNFSLIFGVGAKTFMETLWKEAGVEWDLGRTRIFIQAWNTLYPEFRRAIDKHDSVVMQRYQQYRVGWIDIGKHVGLNERRWFTKWDVEYYNPERQIMEYGAHKAFNQRVQPSLAQYGIDRWLGEEAYLRQRYEGTRHELVGAGLVLMVHDSSVLLLPTGDAERVVPDLQRMGEDLWERWFPGLPGGLDASKWDAHA